MDEIRTSADLLFGTLIGCFIVGVTIVAARFIWDEIQNKCGEGR